MKRSCSVYNCKKKATDHLIFKIDFTSSITRKAKKDKALYNFLKPLNGRCIVHYCNKHFKEQKYLFSKDSTWKKRHI